MPCGTCLGPDAEYLTDVNFFYLPIILILCI